MPGDFHAEFLLLSEQISNHRWRWNANLDGQHPWAMGNDLSLLGIHMHFTLDTPHLVDTCLIVWAGAHVGSAISPKYLCYWMWQSGLADLLPTLRREAVYVGLSGGSMVVTPTIGVYDDPKLPTGSDRMLGLVDFTLFPHLDHPDMPDTSLANIERWAAGLPVPAYAIDDQTAIKVTDGTVEVISEGHWKRFVP